jgi:hypothetical protein
MAKRNARLAEALGIAPDRREEKNIVYAEDLMVFARANQKFCLLVEKTFSEYVCSFYSLEVGLTSAQLRYIGQEDTGVAPHAA